MLHESLEFHESPEPSLAELLEDPIVEMLLQSDRVDHQEFHQLLRHVTEQLNGHPAKFLV